MTIRVPKFSIPIPAKLVPTPARDSSAYKTAEHKGWAKQVKKLAGFACQRCGRSGVRLYADHIEELTDGGTWDLANGQCLCGSCHTVKTLQARANRWAR